MKKKLIAAMLCVAMVATALVGCGSKGGDDASNGGDDKKAASDLKVGVFYYTYSDAYISSVRTALDEKLEGLGVDFQDYDGNSSQTTQNEQIDTAIQTGTNLLIVNIVTSGSDDASTQIIDKAKAADVPVIFFNRAIESEDTAKKEEGKIIKSYDKCAFVGTDAPEAGHLQGEMIGDYVVENFDKMDLNKDGKISYAMFMGQLGNPEAIYRTQFAVEDANKKLEAANKPALEYFDASNKDKYQVDQDGNWSTAAANNYMTTNLSQYNEANKNMIELIICNNDGMAEGAIAALNDKGWNTGDPEKTIPVFGVDATDAAKKLIADGKMVGTIKQDAEGMAQCITDLTKNVSEGKDMMDGTDSYNKSEKVDTKIYIPYGKYTGEGK